MASGRLPAGKSANKPAKKVLQALELFGGKKRMLIDEITVIAVELHVLGGHVQGVGITHRRGTFPRNCNLNIWQSAHPCRIGCPAPLNQTQSRTNDRKTPQKNPTTSPINSGLSRW